MTEVIIQTETDILLARQHGKTQSQEMGFNSFDQTKIATAISELARNILKYAGTGKITIRAVNYDEGIEVVAEDNGPGIANIDLAMMDGYSTAGSQGFGLPGTKRIVDDFIIESEVGKGTNVTIRMKPRRHNINQQYERIKA